MPTTRGLNFFAADPNLAFALRQRARPDDVERALPLLAELGGIAGGELDALAMTADQHPPTLRNFDEFGRRVDETSPLVDALSCVKYVQSLQGHSVTVRAEVKKSDGTFIHSDKTAPFAALL